VSPGDTVDRTVSGRCRCNGSLWGQEIDRGHPEAGVGGRATRDWGYGQETQGAGELNRGADSGTTRPRRPGRLEP